MSCSLLVLGPAETPEPLSLPCGHPRASLPATLVLW